MNKNKKNRIGLVSVLAVLLLASACGAADDGGSQAAANTQPSGGAEANSGASGNTGANPPDSEPENPVPDAEDPADDVTSEDILILIDQTPKPIEGNSFDFTVKQRPEGYALAEMRWTSDKSQVVNTTAEAIAHGGNGEDGFYISGDGQFMGFFYPDDMKGETGEVAFVFRNEQGRELIWKKTITLTSEPAGE